MELALKKILNYQFGIFRARERDRDRDWGKKVVPGYRTVVVVVERVLIN